ncbi:MAG TPA: ABC transporter ATP-binding protein [Thermomicrobiales bacterium]|nr:ABC transporter ATP-binding protein [Thermomicrobiales bacterium]
MPELLEMRHVTKVFGGTRWLRRGTGMMALDDFSMTVQSEPSSITAIVGESGSGKTTLARLLLGLVTPTSGDVLYRGTNIHDLNREQRRQYLKDVQVILQDPYEVYNPFYKVDHVLKTPIHEFGLATSSSQAQTLMEETLNSVGLRPEDTLGRHPHQLSGGQRQRIMVARALLLQPRLIIADEPVSMVDASLRATILESLRLLHTKFGISMLYITHDLTTAYQISQNIIVLYRGEVAEAGDVRVVVRQPLHPYTQLLIESIPAPDTTKTWKQERLVGNTVASQSPPTQGCRFANRCPHVMDICRSLKPPLFRTEQGRAVACFLYRDQPELGTQGIEQVFARPAAAISPAGHVTMPTA